MMILINGCVRLLTDYLSYRLLIQLSILFVSGKSIWTLAVSDDHGIIATGGGDSSIRLWSLSDIMNKHSSKSTILSLPFVRDILSISVHTLLFTQN